MPNWTLNRVTAEGEEGDVRAFLDAVKSDDQVFDFNRIIPIPQILSHTVSGSREFDGRKYASWFVENPGAAFNDRIERPFTEGEQSQLKEIGHSDWYSWCCANWGTKWNACDPEIEDEKSIRYGSVAIIFSTAWNEPEPIFYKIAKLFPKLTFSFEWRHEDESVYPHSFFIEAEAA